MFEHGPLTSQRGEEAVLVYSSTSKRNNKYVYHALKFPHLKHVGKQCMQ